MHQHRASSIDDKKRRQVLTRIVVTGDGSHQLRVKHMCPSLQEAHVPHQQEAGHPVGPMTYSENMPR